MEKLITVIAWLSILGLIIILLLGIWSGINTFLLIKIFATLSIVVLVCAFIIKFYEWQKKTVK